MSITETAAYAEYRARGGCITSAPAMPAMGDLRPTLDMIKRSPRPPMPAALVDAVPADLGKARLYQSRAQPPRDTPTQHIRDIASLASDGKTPEQLAHLLGIKLKSVQESLRTARRAGLLPDPPPPSLPPVAHQILNLVGSGLGYSDISARLGIPLPSVKWLAKRARRVLGVTTSPESGCKRDPERDARIHAAVTGGETTAAVAAREGVTTSRINQIVRRYRQEHADGR